MNSKMKIIRLYFNIPCISGPLLMLLILLPLLSSLFSTSGTQDQIILVNSTL